MVEILLRYVPLSGLEDDLNQFIISSTIKIPKGTKQAHPGTSVPRHFVSKAGQVRPEYHQASRALGYGDSCGFKFSVNVYRERFSLWLRSQLSLPLWSGRWCGERLTQR